MELDDLKAGWAALDRRMAALELAVATKGAAAGVRAELMPLRWGQAAQAVFGLAVAMGAGSFWVEHRDAAGPLVAGLLLHAYGIAMIIAAARNLFLAARASASAPVVELQARVAALRAWRIREGRWFGIIGCFMWVPMVVWAFALLGVDIVRAAPLFMGLQVLAAFVCLGVFFVLSRLQKLPEGRSVRRARERLDEVARFTAGGPA
ncbi:hypothetical protein [Luteibacter yeojuensis]|uniref:Serine/threonine protein kinase n=1 Tax=Luteibacter yeojuensis TaxID=345309 RepID=A0A0F3K545_9GAMM|nr:hypothetical protein [Luteibacter yeojuensis]KJV26395.1 hypothetical protein VI08_18890 [Luteibacter yeojuensis]